MDGNHATENYFFERFENQLKADGIYKITSDGNPSMSSADKPPLV